MYNCLVDLDKDPNKRVFFLCILQDYYGSISELNVFVDVHEVPAANSGQIEKRS